MAARELKFVTAAHHFELAANSGTHEVAAQGRYELAQLYSRQEHYGRAVREFLALMHGYDGTDSQAIKQLQAKAGQAAAECTTILAASADSPKKRDQLSDRAARYWQYVAEEHPESIEATAARQRANEIVAHGTSDILVR